MHKDKLLILDSLLPNGHKQLSYQLIGFLSNDFKITILNGGNYYDDLEIDDIDFVNTFQLKYTKWAVINIILGLVNKLLTIVKIGKFKNDKKIFLSFNTSGFFLFHLFLKQVFLFHHNNTDQLKSKQKYFFFSLYKNKVKHIVFAPFIKNYLTESIGVKKENVFVLNHPLKNNYNSEKSNKISSNLFVAISSSNDDDKIQEFINYEEETKQLVKNGINIIIKSHTINYKSESIYVTNKYLSSKDYTGYIRESKGVILFFPDSYQYRFSASILDSLQENKFVLGYEIPIINHFSEILPNSCFSLPSTEKLFSRIIKVSKNNATHNAEINAFLQLNSDEQIKQNFVKIILSA